MIRKALTEHLFDEHILVNKYVDKVETLSFELEKEVSLTLLKIENILPLLKKFIVDIHHWKEEEVLFPLIQANVPLQRGGPQCTHFMTFKLFNDPTSWIFREAEKRKMNTSMPEKYLPYKAVNSPLMIPLEEHLAGDLAIQMAWQELDLVKKNQKNSSHLLSVILQKYVDLLRIHSKKEDDCLFILADQFLNEDQQKEKILQIQSSNMQTSLTEFQNALKQI